MSYFQAEQEINCRKQGCGFHGTNGTVFVKEAELREIDEITCFYSIRVTIAHDYHSFRESRRPALIGHFAEVPD